MTPCYRMYCTSYSIFIDLRHIHTCAIWWAHPSAGCWHMIYSAWTGTISINKSKSSFCSRECSAIALTNQNDMTSLHVGGPHGRRGWLGGRRRNRITDCICCCDKTGCIQDAAGWPAFSLQARQWNGDGKYWECALSPHHFSPSCGNSKAGDHPEKPGF